MDNNTNTNKFLDWITQIYVPTCIVYSTELAKATIAKNNLTPAEFLRPFGHLMNTTISFIVSDKTIPIKNFRLDFFDSESFKKFNFKDLGEIFENCFAKNCPEWTVDKFITIDSFASFFQYLKNKSYPWYIEFERIIFEALYFNEHEMYQQPFGHIFVMNIKDEIQDLDGLKRKNLPLLLTESIYEIKMPNLIIIVYDPKADKLSNDFIVQKIKLVKEKNPNALVFYTEINLISNNDQGYDIWEPYIHSLTLYSNYRKTNNQNQPKGLLVTQDEKDSFKKLMIQFVTEFIKPYLQKFISELDDDIMNNKKGFRNSFLNVFKGTEKVEYVQNLNIYKLTPMEKKLYVLTIIQFHLRDFDSCIENIKILIGDIKSKSNEHFNCLNEMLNLCMFIVAKDLRPNEVEAPYYLYQKNGNKNIIRYIFTMIRYYDFHPLKKFKEIPKIALKAIKEITFPFLTPLLFEKASGYYLLTQPISVKKFCFCTFQAGLAYRNQQGLDLKRNALFCFGMLYKIFENIKNWEISNNILNNQLGELCLATEYYEGSLKFYKNCLQYSKNKFDDQDAVLIRHFLKSHSSLTSLYKSTNTHLPPKTDDITVIEVINNTLTVFDDQDKNLLITRGWNYFSKFDKNYKQYVRISDADLTILENLEHITYSKQKPQAKVYKIDTNRKIYCKIFIRNCLSVQLSISSIKLICTYTNNNNDNNEILLETKNLVMEMNSTIPVVLSFTPKQAGPIKLEGIEIGLFKVSVFKHYFNAPEPKNEYLCSFEDHVFRDKNVYFDVVEPNHNIEIEFDRNEQILYNYQLEYYKFKLINKSNFGIKRFTFFFEENSVVLTNNLNNIYFENEIPKDGEFELKIPLCPRSPGSSMIKMLIKFEDETNRREIEIKRFLLRFVVLPSIKFDFKDEIVFQDKEKSIFNLDSFIIVEHNSDLKNVEINKVLLNSLTSFTKESDKTWNSINDNANQKLYTKLVISKKTTPEITNINKHKNSNKNIIKNINKEDKDDDNEDSEVIVYDNSVDLSFIDDINTQNILKNFLAKNYIIFYWKSHVNSFDKTIEGLLFYENILKVPVIKTKYMKELIKNSLEVEVVKKSDLMIQNIKQSLIQIKMKVFNKFEIFDTSQLEIYVSDEENEYNWIGMKKVLLNSNEKYWNLLFNVLTPKSGLLNLNKFHFIFHKNNVSEKPVVISHVPLSIQVDI